MHFKGCCSLKCPDPVFHRESSSSPLSTVPPCAVRSKAQTGEELQSPKETAYLGAQIPSRVFGEHKRGTGGSFKAKEKKTAMTEVVNRTFQEVQLLFYPAPNIDPRLRASPCSILDPKFFYHIISNLSKSPSPLFPLLSISFLFKWFGCFHPF